jgi:hypothetical protein
MASAFSELCDAYVDPESGYRPCHKIVHDSECTNDGQQSKLVNFSSEDPAIDVIKYDVNPAVASPAVSVSVRAWSSWQKMATQKTYVDLNGIYEHNNTTYKDFGEHLPLHVRGLKQEMMGTFTTVTGATIPALVPQMTSLLETTVSDNTAHNVFSCAMDILENMKVELKSDANLTKCASYLLLILVALVGMSPRLHANLITKRLKMCQMLQCIILLGFVRETQARRPDFEKSRAGSEFLRRRDPYSADEPFRFKYHLREKLPTGDIMNVKYDVTRFNTTRVLDEMEAIEHVRCVNESLIIILAQDYRATDVMGEFHINAVVNGGLEWNCTDASGQKAPFSRLVHGAKIVGADIVLNTSLCSPFESFSREDIEVWTERERGEQSTRGKGNPTQAARTQMLWNAGADDEVGGSGSSYEDDDDKGFSPRQWLASQHDDAEMRETGVASFPPSLLLPHSLPFASLPQKTNNELEICGDSVRVQAWSVSCAGCALGPSS